MGEEEKEQPEVEGTTEGSETEQSVEGEELENSENENQDLENSENEEPEMVVTIGDEEPEEREQAPEWVKEVRANNRELAKENKRLQGQIESMSGGKPEDPGKKPTLEDFDYDPDQYETAFNAWHEKKSKLDYRIADQEKQKTKDEADWNAKLESYNQKKAELKFDDVEESEGVILDLMSTTQQGMIVQGADNAALLLYALGKNPKKAKELASIQEPVKFAFAVAKLEEKLKVTQRKPANAPERKVSGSGPVMNAGDKELNRLREEAEKTGDMSKVVAYKRKLRKQA